jgi:hypothetical protein
LWYVKVSLMTGAMLIGGILLMRAFLEDLL